MVVDAPQRRGWRQRLAARAFGGASDGVFRGMITLALGSGIGRVIGVASIPVLTRLYTPEDFGVLAVFTAMVAILALLVTLRYALAVPLPRHDGVAMNLLVLSTGLMLGLTGLFALALWLWGAPLLALVSMQVLTPWRCLISLGVLGTAAYELLTMWGTRKRAYKVIAQTNVTQSAAGALVKIGLGLAALHPLGLLVGQVVAQTGGIGRLISGFRAEFRANWRYVRASRMRKAAWRHRGFPLYRMLSQLFLVFSLQSPVIMAASVFGAATAGQLGLAMSAIAVPATLFGSSVGNALYGEAARIGKRDPARLSSLAWATQLRLFIIAMVPAGVLFLIGPALFKIMFGPEWELAGYFVSLLSPYLLFQFTSAPMMQMMNLLDAQHMFLGINLLRAAGLVALMAATHRFEFDAISFVAAFSAFNAAVYALISLFVVLKLKQNSAGL